MVHIFKWGLITGLLLITPFLHAASFNGYLVSLKENSKLANFEFTQLGLVSPLHLSFAQIFHFVPNQPLSKSDLQKIAHDSGVLHIEPNTIFTAHSANDKNFWDNQWGLHNTGSNNWAKGPAGEDIAALKAWGIATGKRNIIIAVVDSGVDRNHPDLAPNIFVNKIESNGTEGIDDDGNGYVDDINGYDFANDDAIADDLLGHGTHVAGVIGASHNGFGVNGVMDKVQILPLKFITKERKGELKHALLAINYAINMNVHIINNSWGSSSASEFLLAAIEAAHQKEIFVVCSAGNKKNNNDLNPVYPSGFNVPNIISVAATNGRGEKASFSNYGPNTVHLFAPGTMIVSTDINANQYRWRSGTSMATPMVSGALGLLLSHRPDIPYQDVLKRLITTTDNKAKLSKWAKGGRLNLFNLIKKSRATTSY